MNSHERRDNSIPTLEMLDSIQAFQRVLALKDGKVLYLPMLHVLYYRQIGPYGERGIGAACLEFGFFAWGENRQSAEECLEPLVLSYFRRRIENKEFREILNDVSDDFMEPSPYTGFNEERICRDQLNYLVNKLKTDDETVRRIEKDCSFA